MDNEANLNVNDAANTAANDNDGKKVYSVLITEHPNSEYTINAVMEHKEPIEIDNSQWGTNDEDKQHIKNLFSSGSLL